MASILSVAISSSSSGNNTILTPPTGKRVVVHSYVIVAAAAVSAKWITGSTDKSGAMPLAANGGISCAQNEMGWFGGEVDEALILNLSGAQLVAGHLRYSLR